MAFKASLKLFKDLQSILKHFEAKGSGEDPSDPSSSSSSQEWMREPRAFQNRSLDFSPTSSGSSESQLVPALSGADLPKVGRRSLKLFDAFHISFLYIIVIHKYIVIYYDVLHFVLNLKSLFFLGRGCPA